MHIHKHILAVLAICLFILPLLGQDAADNTTSADNGLEGVSEINGDEIEIRFAKEVQLEYFIRLVAKQTRKIFIYDPGRVSNLKVYILADRIRIKKGALYALLLALLEHQQLTITSYGENSDETVEIYQIQLIKDAQNNPIDFNSKVEDMKERAQIASMLVHLQYAEPNSVARAIKSLIPANFNIQAIMSTGLNAVIMTGMEYQIRNISKMIELLDKPGPQLELAVIPVQYADVTDIAQMLNTLVTRSTRMNAYGNRGRTSSSNNDTVSLEADERTNSIIVQGTEEDITMVRQLIKRLDIAMPEEEVSRIQIYYCKHTKAEELATTLNNLNLSQLFEDARSASSSGTYFDPYRGVYIDNRWRNNQNNQNNQDQEIKIASDERTNSLIITARPDDYLEIKRLIDNLDIRKPQVMIEAAIIEVSADHNLEFGVELLSTDKPKEGSIRASAGTDWGYSDIVDENGVPVSSGGGVPAGRLPRYGQGAVFALMQNDYFSIPMLIKAIQSDTDANVLSRPKLLTNDTVEATIKDY